MEISETWEDEVGKLISRNPDGQVRPAAAGVPVGASIVGLLVFYVATQLGDSAGYARHETVEVLRLRCEPYVFDQFAVDIRLGDGCAAVCRVGFQG